MGHLGITVGQSMAPPICLVEAVRASPMNNFAMRMDGPYCAGITFLPRAEREAAMMSESAKAKALKDGYLPADTWMASTHASPHVHRHCWVAVVGDLVYRRLTKAEYYAIAGTLRRRSEDDGAFYRGQYGPAGSPEKWDVRCLGPLGMETWPSFEADHKTSTVLALLDQIASKLLWENTPILADALQDTGYDHQWLLECLRSEPGPTMNAKRKWAVDVLSPAENLHGKFKGKVFDTPADLVDDVIGD